MIHPLLRLAATEPHLLGDHVEAYAALVGEEVNKVSTSLILRIALYGAALFMVAVGCIVFARSRPSEKPFDTIKKQLNADMAMLREVSAS